MYAEGAPSGFREPHAARADLLRRLGRPADAVLAYARAADLATSDAERAFREGRPTAVGSLGDDEMLVSSRA